MRTVLWAAFIAFALLVAVGCSTVRQPPLRLDPPVATVPATVLNLVAPSHADRVVCRRFGAVRQTERSALRFMAWAATGRGRGTASRASQRLIVAAVKWFDDTYEAFGIPADAGPDLARIRADCASISVSRHSRGRA